MLARGSRLKLAGASWLALAALAALVACSAYGDEPSAAADAGPIDAATSDAGGAKDSGPSGRCPASGAKMISIEIGGASFCIDATEATQAEYGEFLESVPDPAKQGIECAFNQKFLPEHATFEPAFAKQPVPVNWCQAKAYCEWRGKRLCRHREGRALDLGTDDLGTVSEWSIACSRGGARRYPYGQSYNPTACNGLPLDGSAPVPVGSLATCEGGFDGLFDMAGNLAEWEDNCTAVPADAGPTAGRDSHCEVRGGQYQDPEPSQYLACNTSRGVGRSQLFFGIRCCAD